MVGRRGATNLGCLLPLLIVAIAVYFAIDFGQVYFRAYQFKDAMTSEANFASTLTDEAITRRLVALADSLQLPPGAEERAGDPLSSPGVGFTPVSTL